jgi:hypothetical protein
MALIRAIQMSQHTSAYVSITITLPVYTSAYVSIALIRAIRTLCSSGTMCPQAVTVYTAVREREGAYTRTGEVMLTYAGCEDIHGRGG